MSCPHCGHETPSNECCVWAKADAYEEMKELVLHLENENKDLRALADEWEEENKRLEYRLRDVDGDY